MVNDKWRWISVKEKLPPMFVNVIVIGTIPHFNVMPQMWEARRFSGWTSGWPGINEGKGPSWEWLGLQDRTVKDVKFWMPVPEQNIEDNPRAKIISALILAAEMIAKSK